MSEFVEKIIEEKGEQIEKETVESINAKAKEATERLKRLLEELKEKAKIVLPVNVIDIMAKGGEVVSIEHNVVHDHSRVSLDIYDRNVFFDKFEHDLRVNAGKYRVTLIMEWLGPAERNHDP